MILLERALALSNSSVTLDLEKVMAYTLAEVNHLIHSKGGIQMPEVEIGKVSDFFAHPVVAGIELTAPLKQGDKIHIVGHTTDMEMTVDSMQIDNKTVQQAKKGEAIGIKVNDRVRKGDTVYKVS